MPEIPFNMNDAVLIKITPAGKEYLKRIDMLWKLTPGYSTAEREDGWASWQLHDIAHTFGPECYMGNMDLPFETEIRIPLKENN